MAFVKEGFRKVCFRIAKLTVSKLFLVVLTAGLSFSIAGPAAGVEDEQDYWEKAPKVWQEMQELRRIEVSAQTKGDRTFSKGAGFVKAKVPSVWAFATHPEKIRKSSRFLKEFIWDPATGDVEMQIELLYVSHRLKGKAHKLPDAENPRIQFKVLEGSLVPFEGELEIRSALAHAKRKNTLPFPKEMTLVRISGVSSEGRSLSWPMRVALEAVLQRTAGALRAAVEAEENKQR